MSQITSKAKNNKSESLELFLYFFLVLASDLLLLPIVVATKSENGKLDFDINWKDNFPPFSFIPLILVLVTILIALWILRTKRSKKKMSPLILSLAIVYSLYRLLGIFLFPYGSQEYSMTFQNQNYSIQYSGFSIYNRVTTWISETYFIFLLAFLYNYTPTYSNKIWTFLKIFLLAFVLTGLCAIAYSVIVEGKAMFQLWKNYFQNGCKELSTEMYFFTSFTTHRNVFAFLLMLASFASAILLIKTNHFYWIAFNVLFAIWTLLILSRTAFLLDVFVIFFLLILYPVCHFYSHHKKSIFCITLLSILILGAVLFFCIFKDSSFVQKAFQKITDFFKNGDSLSMRSIHCKIAMEMLKEPYYFIFGYNRAPFLGIYPEFEVRIIPDDLVWTVHNSYLQLWMDSGFLALIYAVSAFLYLLYQSLYVTVKKDKKFLLYFVLFGLLCFYAYIEPRMLFLKEGTTALYMLMILIPIHYEYHSSKDKSKIYQDLVHNLD